MIWYLIIIGKGCLCAYLFIFWRDGLFIIHSDVPLVLLMWLGTLCVCTLHHFNRQNVMTRHGGGGSSKNPPKISSLDVVSHKCKSHIISVSGHCVRFILKRLSNCCRHNTLWCFGSYADIGNWELLLHENHFYKKPYFYQYYLSYKVSICKMSGSLGKIYIFST